MAGNLNIVILWLYDARGERLLTGGMERWCRDAARLIRSQGYRVRIWQKSTEPFCREIEEDISVHGLRASLKFRGNRTLAKALEQRNMSDEPWLFVSQEIQGFGTFPRSVAVNHGIWWNGDFPWWKRVLNKRLQRRLLLGSRATICVDTNYINWCHAELPGRREWEGRLVYIPNYADLHRFRPVVQRTPAEPASPTILFPRRVMGRDLDRDVRGAGLLIRAVEILEAEGMTPRLIFAGRGNLQSEIEGWADRRMMRNRVEVTEATLDEMPALYARADVVVVPTLAHEGTSLAAVEAIVSGKPVVVSHIGGLGNIVIDRLNGSICDLTPESLAGCVRQVLADRPLSRSPGVLDSCRASLGKDRWDRKVWTVLQSRLEL